MAEQFPLITQVVLGPAQAIGGNIRAFIETGSGSASILATLSECNGHFPAIMFCSTRTFGGNQGIMITLTCPDGLPVAVSVTVCQVGAQKYNPPILYTGQ